MTTTITTPRTCQCGCRVPAPASRLRDVAGLWILDSHLRDHLDESVRGLAAIEYAERHGLRCRKAADPTEDARSGLSTAEARQIAREDPSLITVDTGAA